MTPGPRPTRHQWWLIFLRLARQEYVLPADEWLRLGRQFLGYDTYERWMMPEVLLLLAAYVANEAPVITLKRVAEKHNWPKEQDAWTG